MPPLRTVAPAVAAKTALSCETTVVVRSWGEHPDSTKCQTSLIFRYDSILRISSQTVGKFRRFEEDPDSNEVFPKIARSLGLLSILPNPIKNPRDLNGVLFYVGILNKFGISYTFPFTKIATSCRIVAVALPRLSIWRH